jgi:hypothetical protein
MAAIRHIEMLARSNPLFEHNLENTGNAGVVANVNVVIED